MFLTIAKIRGIVIVTRSFHRDVASMHGHKTIDNREPYCILGSYTYPLDEGELREKNITTSGALAFLVDKVSFHGDSTRCLSG